MDLCSFYNIIMGIVFGEMLIDELEEFLAYVSFHWLIEWWIEPNYPPFVFVFTFGCSGCFIPECMFV